MLGQEVARRSETCTSLLCAWPYRASSAPLSSCCCAGAARRRQLIASNKTRAHSSASKVSRASWPAMLVILGRIVLTTRWSWVWKIIVRLESLITTVGHGGDLIHLQTGRGVIGERRNQALKHTKSSAPHVLDHMTAAPSGGRYLGGIYIVGEFIMLSSVDPDVCGTKDSTVNDSWQWSRVSESCG